MTQLFTQAYAPFEMPYVLVEPEPEPTPIIYEVTAYTAGLESTGKSPGDPAYGITASGEPVVEGKTAACPPSMAFGTRIHIEGVGERVCFDRGSAITEGKLDIYMTKVSDARAFGRRSLEVRIIDEEESE
jgi:3D (Asp-Asp-Asp) domain-containing protein